MANVRIYSLLDALSIAISAAFSSLHETVTVVLRNVTCWLEAYALPPLDFRETWLFRYNRRLQMAMSRIRLNVARLTAYWLRQHHRRANRNAGWYLIEKPIFI